VLPASCGGSEARYLRANKQEILPNPLQIALSFPAKTCSLSSTAVNPPRVRFPQTHLEKNMQLNVGKEIAAMEQIALSQLRDRYAEVFGDHLREPTLRTLECK
jgi:hypothetical protein